MSDPVNHPDHYNKIPGVECIPKADDVREAEIWAELHALRRERERFGGMNTMTDAL